MTQVKSWQAMFSKRDVLLLAPCGSGKSLVYTTAIDIMRQESPTKVLILCLPVNEVLLEKLKSHPVPTAFVAMSGAVLVDGEGLDDGTGDAALDDELLAAILRGEYAILMGHAESWLSRMGRLLLKALRERNMIGIIVIDELHKVIII